MDKFSRLIVTHGCAFALFLLFAYLIPVNEGYEFLGYGGFVAIASELLCLFIRRDGSNRKSICDVIASLAIGVAIVNIFIYNETSKPDALPQHWHVAVFCLGLGFLLGLLNFYLPSRLRQATV